GDLVAEALRQPTAAELLPRDSLEHGGQLAVDAAGLPERAQREREQDEDREHGETEDASTRALSKREELEHRVGGVRGRHDHEREAGQQDDDDVAVAERAAAPERERDDGDAG